VTPLPPKKENYSAGTTFFIIIIVYREDPLKIRPLEFQRIQGVSQYVHESIAAE
jgi:hypothetical protein